MELTCYKDKGSLVLQYRANLLVVCACVCVCVCVCVCSGELVMWDLAASGKQKWSVLGSGDQNHSRIVFNMSSVCLASGRQLLLTTSMDREVL